jgi:hypothetical protein
MAVNGKGQRLCAQHPALLLRGRLRRSRRGGLADKGIRPRRMRHLARSRQQEARVRLTRVGSEVDH